MVKLKFDLEFQNLSKGENLYDDINLENSSVVDAEYYKREGYEDNPDLCALPLKPSATEVMMLGSVRMPNYDRNKVSELKKFEKYEQIQDMDQVMVPLEKHLDIAQTIHSLLQESYKERDTRYSTMGENNPLEKQGFACNVLSLKKSSAARSTGFFLYGRTGDGKTMAVQLVCRMYPEAIRHTFADISYIQIPIIHVTALQMQMSDVFRSIATRIDEILDTGDFHEARIRSGNLTKAEGYMKKWIKLYHIGLIIIDEIQFLNLSGSGKNIQDFIGIAQDTGCHFGFIGNEDAATKIFALPRIMSRLGHNLIDADSISEDGTVMFMYAMESLWQYQWTEVYSELTGDIEELLFYETTGNIALLKYILIKLQYEAVKNDKIDPITPEYISKVTDKELKKLRNLIASPTDKTELEYHELVSNIRNTMAKDILGGKDGEKGRFLETIARGRLTGEHARIKNEAIQSILNTTDFSESQINRAITKVLDEEPSLIERPAKFLAKRTMDELNRVGSNIKKNKTRKTNQLINAVEKDEVTNKALLELKGENNKKRKDA